MLKALLDVGKIFCFLCPKWVYDLFCFCLFVCMFCAIFKFCFLLVIILSENDIFYQSRRESQVSKSWSIFLSSSSCGIHFPDFWYFFTAFKQRTTDSLLIFMQVNTFFVLDFFSKVLLIRQFLSSEIIRSVLYPLSIKSVL